MATAEDVKKLAALARIKVSDDELPKFVKEFDAILSYVGQLEQLELPTDQERKRPELRNVMRGDDEPHTPGIYTERIVAQFPTREDNALSVKQIISHD